MHDEISAYLYGVGVVFHGERSGTCGIIAAVKRLNTIIALNVQLAAVHEHAAARLNKVSCNGQLVSVEVKRSSRQVQIAVDNFIFLERPTGALAVGKRYVAAVVQKFNNGSRRREYNAVLREVLNIQHIKLRLSGGERHDTGFASNPEMAEKAVECLKEYMRDFSKRNPNFYVFNAVVHKDEATPHMHFDFIPFADGYKTGMTRQQGIAKALEQMGYGKGEKAYINFTQSERNVFREICERHGIEVADEEKGRGETLTTAAYREYAEVKEKTQIAEKNLEQLSTENETKITQVISDFATGKGAKKVAAADKIINGAELVNETLCKANLEKEQQLIYREKALEKHEAEIKSLAAYQLKRQEQLDRAVETHKANEKRLQRGFARLKVTIEREVQRVIANLAPFKELFAENDRFKRRMVQVQQTAEKAVQRNKGDIER